MLAIEEARHYGHDVRYVCCLKQSEPARCNFHLAFNFSPSWQHTYGWRSMPSVLAFMPTLHQFTCSTVLWQIRY